MKLYMLIAVLIFQNFSMLIRSLLLEDYGALMPAVIFMPLPPPSTYKNAKSQTVSIIFRTLALETSLLKYLMHDCAPDAKQVSRALSSNHAVPLFSVYSDVRIKIAHQYEGLCIRHFRQSTLHFFKKGIIFFLQIERIDVYQGQRCSLLCLLSDDYQASADKLPFSDCVSHVWLYQNTDTGLSVSGYRHHRAISNVMSLINRFSLGHENLDGLNLYNITALANKKLMPNLLGSDIARLSKLFSMTDTKRLANLCKTFTGLGKAKLMTRDTISKIVKDPLDVNHWFEISQVGDSARFDQLLCGLIEQVNQPEELVNTLFNLIASDNAEELFAAERKTSRGRFVRS
ncbi:unnamed protein product [Soboliphyme baturini]|uniref:DUF4835 domain-containing protein n=1 Tax=Soboliphyme baturini TaxID=241478 RepID=A0A183IEV6_9BILA|nr:unnamed protein product [Soboliphyme baturini]